MNKLGIIILIILVITVGVIYSRGVRDAMPFLDSQEASSTEIETQMEEGVVQIPDERGREILATQLDTPWAVGVIPDGYVLVTERPGRVRVISPDGKLSARPAVTIAGVKEIGEGGLLGLALDPDFETNKTVYLYYTYSGENDTLNRVVSMTYDSQTQSLGQEKTLLNGIPGNSNHNGGRIAFGPDGHLYVGTGDAQDPSQSQNTQSLGGKILRITTQGDPAPGNPFNNEVYSYGHRNVQGLAWNTEGELWATEHGRSGVQSGLDELNLIEAGNNYGWPDIEGDETADGMVAPRRSSANITWAPSGSAFVGSSLFFSGLRGQTLYEAVVRDGQVLEVKEHYKGELGRIREVLLGPDNMLYLTTSNQDGRGSPSDTDDRVLRVNPSAI